MSADDEGGVVTSLPRPEKAGRVDMDRVMVLRVAIDIDRHYPGHSAGESLAKSLNSTLGFVSQEIIYRVGSPVVHEIVGHWDRRRGRATAAELRPEASRRAGEHRSCLLSPGLLAAGDARTLGP